MDIQTMLAAHGDASVRYALTGAKGGFARTLLAQTVHVPRLEAGILCDLDVDGARALAVEVGFAPDRLRVCVTTDEVEAAVADGVVAIVATPELLLPGGFDILVEATGSPSFGSRVAQAALEAGRHVAMVSKEVDSVAGIHLAAVAAAHGVVYTPASGDQPANLIALVGWVRTLGLEIVAVGKSSEYDLVLDPASGVVTQLDDRTHAPGLAELLVLGDDVRATLAARAAAVSGLPIGATADYCEMAVVATNTGMVSDVELMHYPVARIAELADVYALEEHGGIVRRPGVVDVFRALRTPDEASFAGGVFVVVRTHDRATWEVLRGKGHVVSRDGRTACIYLPYHFMGVETPINLLETVLLGGTYGSPAPTRTVVLAGRARTDLPAGTTLHMGGHHHDVEGVQAVLVDAATLDVDAAPLYLAAHATLARDVAAGDLLSVADLDGHDPALLESWRAGETTTARRSAPRHV